MEFERNAAIETMEFNVNLQVNPMISTTDIDGTFTISGEWRYKTYGTSGSIPSVSGLVTIEPYYWFIGVVKNQDDLMGVPIGTWRTAEFEVINQGNERVTITITAVGKNQTLDCQIGSPSVTLNEGESKIVLIKVRKKTGPVEPTTYEQLIRLEARVKGGEIIIYETSIFLETIYTPRSFFVSIWFKLSIAGVIILAILITILIIRRRRKNRRNERTEGIEI